MARRVQASRVRFVRYPAAVRAAPVAPPQAALALDDDAVLADADGAVVVFSDA